MHNDNIKQNVLSRMAFSISREAQFEKLLQSDDIAAHVLKAACLHGIPDNADLRAEAWRVLLGVVELTADDGHSSNDYTARKASKARKRKQYYDLATELLAGPLSVSNPNRVHTPLSNARHLPNLIRLQTALKLLKIAG